MLSKGEATAACVTGVVLGAIAGGCVVVVDRNPEAFDWDDTPSRPRMGVYTAEPGRTLATQLKFDRTEATVITDVVRNSPAERAGIRPYDIVTAIDGSPEADPGDFRRAIRAHQWGDAMTLRILRDGQPMDVLVTLDPPESRENPKY